MVTVLVVTVLVVVVTLGISPPVRFDSLSGGTERRGVGAGDDSGKDDSGKDERDGQRCVGRGVDDWGESGVDGAETGAGTKCFCDNGVVSVSDARPFFLSTLFFDSA